MSIHYDRRLAPSVVGLLAPGRPLAPGGPLAWMVDLVRSQWGVDNFAHIEFRCADEGARRSGRIQFYVGRTAPLEVVEMRKGHVKFDASKTYQVLNPSIFDGPCHVSALAAKRATLEAHIREATAGGDRSFFDGEARPHAGLMRRYGLDHRAGDPLLAVDSEIRVGFRGEGASSGTALRERFVDELRQAIDLPAGEASPHKHDTLGILSSGEIALVEVKDERGDVVRAVYQAAAFVYRLNALLAQPGYDLMNVLDGMVAQKVKVGLMPPGTAPAAAAPLRLVPIVAAPDARPDWANIWRSNASRVLEQASNHLNGLRFWRLSPSGEVVDEVMA